MSGSDDRDEIVRQLEELGWEVIHAYPLEQALEDGVLHTFMEELWPKMSGGKPVVLSHDVWLEVDQVTLLEQWNMYVYWCRHTMPHLPEEDRMYTDTVNGKDFWVLCDGAAYTMLFASDY